MPQIIVLGIIAVIKELLLTLHLPILTVFQLKHRNRTKKIFFLCVVKIKN